MIKVTYREDLTGFGIWDMTITGHANQAEVGKDIVCAAVSILWRTLLIELEKCRERGWLAMEYEDEIGSVWVHVKCYTMMNLVMEWFRFAMDGIVLIAEEYPQYLTVKEEKKNGDL